MGGSAIGSCELVGRLVAGWRGELALIVDGLQQRCLVLLYLAQPPQLLRYLLPDSALVRRELLVEGLIKRVLDVHELLLQSQIPAFPAFDRTVDLAPQLVVFLCQLLVSVFLLEEQIVDPLDLVAELSDPARVLAHQIGPIVQLRLAFPVDLVPTAQTALLEVLQLLGQPSALTLQVLVLILQQLYLLLEFLDVEVVVVSVHEAPADGVLGRLGCPHRADGLVDGRGGPDDDVAAGDVGAGRPDWRLADLPVDEPAHLGNYKIY